MLDSPLIDATVLRSDGEWLGVLQGLSLLEFLGRFLRSHGFSPFLLIAPMGAHVSTRKFGAIVQSNEVLDHLPWNLKKDALAGFPRRTLPKGNNAREAAHKPHFYPTHKPLNRRIRNWRF
jgi:hypothetical protein